MVDANGQKNEHGAACQQQVGSSAASAGWLSPKSMRFKQRVPGYYDMVRIALATSMYLLSYWQRELRPARYKIHTVSTCISRLTGIHDEQL